MRNLAKKGVELSALLVDNVKWLTREVGFVVDGSYNSEKIYSEILDLYDASRENRGKRNNNLVAKVGLHFIKEHFGVKPHQAVSIFNYLTAENKKLFSKITRELIDDLMSEQ